MLTPGRPNWQQIIVKKSSCTVHGELVGKPKSHLLAEGEGEQSPLHPRASFIVEGPPFSKAVHKEAHPRACHTDHLRESLLAHLQHHGPRLPSRTGGQQKNSRLGQETDAGSIEFALGMHCRGAHQVSDVRLGRSHVCCVDCDLAAVEPHAPGLAKLIVRNCAVWTGRTLLSRIMLHLSWG
jgi:hypothetical protein